MRQTPSPSTPQPSNDRTTTSATASSSSRMKRPKTKFAKIKIDPSFQVRKRDGSREQVDPLQITLKVARAASGLPHVDPSQVAQRAIDGIYDGVTTSELDALLIQNAAMLISEEPEYSKLAARLLDVYIAKEVWVVRGIESFYESLLAGHRAGLICDETFQFVRENALALNDAVHRSYSDRFEYFGLRTVYDRYLLRDPKTRDVIETAQYFFMRVACGLAQTAEEAIELYELISSFEYIPSTPTLFNSGTKHAQMSSCYLLDSPGDDLAAIYDKYKDVAMLSKFAGGIGLAYHRVRSRGSLIRGTNGNSNGVVPFLKTLDSSVSAVNQGGKRKGACCIYLECWHADIYDFMALRNNTGNEAQRTHNLNLANWIPDLFMKRVRADEPWSLFDPKDVPTLVDLYGEEFESAYAEAEKQELFQRQVPARELYALMMKTLAETGNGWMTFKDAANLKSNQTGLPANVIHLSNLCTEILEVTCDQETAVCNLGSLNLARYVVEDATSLDDAIDYVRLRQNAKTAVKYLDRVVDINFYPVDQARSSNERWRPVGLGVMGLQDVFFKLKIAFDSEDALRISKKIQEEIYFAAMQTSAELAEQYGPHPAFHETRAARGDLQFDLWGIEPEDSGKWDALKARIRESGLRNSLVIAIAPTATIASIVGSYECIEPQVSNLFKRETLSGEFLQINNYLVTELRTLGLWTKAIRAKIKLAEGSIQGIEEIPVPIRKRFRTAWELPQKALIDLAAARGPYIDQSQSLNLFMESPTIGKLSSMYAYAWQKGLKTTYYLRSRAATRINQTGQSAQVETESSADAEKASHKAPRTFTAAEALACSLENPEACEACQ